MSWNQARKALHRQVKNAEGHPSLLEQIERPSVYDSGAEEEEVKIPTPEEIFDSIENPIPSTSRGVKTKVVKKVEDIEKLKIAVRDITDEDISSRSLNKKTSGVVITEISNRSPLTNLLGVNDIIIEVQKSPVKSSSDLKRLVDNFFQKGEKTLLLTVINKNNQRRYLGVKIN